jgi:hypothetical protein
MQKILCEEHILNVTGCIVQNFLPILLYVNVYTLIMLVLQESKLLFAQPFKLYGTLASTVLF